MNKTAPANQLHAEFARRQYLQLTNSGRGHEEIIAELNRLDPTLSSYLTTGDRHDLKHLGPAIDQQAAIAAEATADDLSRRYRALMRPIEAALLYFSAILMIGLICCVVYVQFVYPTLEQIVARVGMPAFTQFVIDAQPFVMVGLIVLIAIFLGLGLDSRIAVSQLRRLKPRTPLIVRLLGSPSSFKQSIALHLLHRVGALSSSSQAEHFVRKGWVSSETAQTIRWANKLGTLSSELESAAEIDAAQTAASFHRTHRVLTIIGTIIIGVVIGACIVGFYLPLFVMGQVI